MGYWAFGFGGFDSIFTAGPRLPVTRYVLSSQQPNDLLRESVERCYVHDDDGS